MSDEYSDDYVPPYPILSSDGAYVHSHMDTVRLLFFLDHKVPKRGEKDSVKYSQKRENVQEIRLSLHAATQICDDLDNLLSRKRENDGQFIILPSAHKDHETEFSEQIKLTWNKLNQSIAPVFSLLNQTTEEGQDKILAIMQDFVTHKRPQFKEIVDEFPLLMTDRYGEKTRRQR